MFQPYTLIISLKTDKSSTVFYFMNENVFIVSMRVCVFHLFCFFLVMQRLKFYNVHFYIFYVVVVVGGWGLKKGKGVHVDSLTLFY